MIGRTALASPNTPLSLKLDIMLLYGNAPKKKKNWRKFVCANVLLS